MLKKVLLAALMSLLVPFCNLAFSMDASLDLKKKIGQMICLDLRYLSNNEAVTEINDKTRPLAEKLIKEYNVGCFILFRENIKI